MKCNLPKVWDDNEWLTVNPERISPVQLEVNKYLRSAQRLYKGGKILHIGIGNSSIAKELRDIFGQIDGITNSQQELEAGKQLSDKYRIYLLNKYNLEEFGKLDNDYDVIVDVSLKSYACCNEHWLGFMNEVINKLKIGGRLLSHTGGFGGHNSSNYDNSLKMEELTQLLEPDSFIFIRLDSNFDYPFIIEKT